MSGSFPLQLSWALVSSAAPLYICADLMNRDTVAFREMDVYKFRMIDEFCQEILLT